MFPFMPPPPNQTPPPPPQHTDDEQKYRNTMRWYASINDNLKAIRLIAILICIFSFTTCTHTCSISNGFTIRPIR